MGISYDADLKKAKSLIEDMLLHDESIIQDEEIRVFVDSLADSAVMIGLRGVGKDRGILGDKMEADGRDQADF